jgi:hypothetical protein
MKRLCIVALVFALALSSFAQATDMTTYTDALTGFSDAFLGTLAINSIAGGVWSDAFIGGFPHFGAGVTVGAVLASKDAILPVFTQLGIPTDQIPAEIQQYGMPIPVATLTAKLGMPFLPIDVGANFSYIWPDAGSFIASSLGMEAEYLSYGLNVRYAILSEEQSFMDLSVGAGVNYVQGRIAKTVSGAGAELHYDLSAYGGSDWTVAFADPTIGFGWSAMTYDFTVQASKKILFFTLYGGVGYTYGNGTVTSSVESAVTADRGSGDELSAFLSEAEAAAAASGTTLPDFSSTGFTYEVASDSPVFRVFAGVSLDLLIVLDLQGLLVFKEEGLYDYGATATVRLQL